MRGTWASARDMPSQFVHEPHTSGEVDMGLEKGPHSIGRVKQLEWLESDDLSLF